MLENVSRRLRPGGYFIGTIPSSGWIMANLGKAEANSFGNDIYRITFEEKNLTPPKFGAKYKFYLQDAVIDVPEYLVHSLTLNELASSFGLDFVMSDTLWNFYQTNKSGKHGSLLSKMRVHNNNGELQLSEDGKELCGLYKVFVFRKRGSPQELDAMENRGVRLDRSYHQYYPPLLAEKDIMVPPPTQTSPTSTTSTNSRTD